MLAVIISGCISTGLLALLLGGLAVALRARGSAIRTALAVGEGRVAAWPGDVTAAAYWPVPRAIAA